ncbi:MAG: hemerythrin domain-containing protein [Bacteroidales bacterium]|nr:hemerythrin domain-containing protein [Bacteroidales bacterium]
MKESIITGSMKMADLVAADPRSMVLITRFGIDLGFGDQTIKQICQEKNIQTDFFLLMVNIFLSSSFFPNQKLKNVDVKLLLTYLANSHEYYIREKIPLIQAMFGNYLGKMDHPAKPQLQSFFDEYIQEVIEHIEYEEQVAFPYVSNLLARSAGGAGKAGRENYGISIFEERHTNIEDKLSDLKNLLIKYLPPSKERFLRIRIINELFDLEQDLGNHARLEDQVLIPLVEQMEKQLNP